MRIYRDLDIVESLGSGIPRILRAYGEDCFHFTDNFIRITFPASVQIDHASGTESGPENGPENTINLIMQQIKANPQVSTRAIAQNLNMARSGIIKHLNKLQEFGVIRRVGPNKGGHWEIVNNDAK